jgi:CMP-N-acetylneuraminic acid synthetase
MIVAIVPARGGSRGLSRKNLRRVGGRSLTRRAVEAARSATTIDRVLVSTDDPAIAAEARAAGAEVPFLRPAHLATDEAATVDVLRHAVGALEQSGVRVEIVVTLQPTSPLRTAAEIDAAVALVRDGGADSAVTVAALDLPWSVVGCLVDGRLVRGEPAGGDARRQAAPPAVRITGSVYVTRRALLDAGALLGTAPAAQLVSGPSTLDIDDARDLDRARRAVARAGS